MIDSEAMNRAQEWRGRVIKAMNKIQMTESLARNIFVDDELWGYAIQVNGKWWLLFERDDETGDLEYFNTADTEMDIRQKVKERISEQEGV